jgi:lycopene elongase/hydratase (dihydrobisanhydrobacterioruberin-forming)
MQAISLHKSLKISRPRFWIYEIGPYIIGVLAAAQSEHTIWLAVPIGIFFLFFTYPANIFIYGINDIHDYETDKLNPKKIAYEALVTPAERASLYTQIALFTIPFVIYAFASLSLHTALLFVLFFFFAGFYSSPPIRAKARPFIDSVFSAGHYVVTALFSYAVASDVLGAPIDWSITAPCVLAGMCWAIAMHAYSAVPDIQADTDANLETFATVLGKRNTILACASLYTISALLSFPYIGIYSLILGALYVFFMIRSLHTTNESLFKIYTYFPTINTISGMIVFFVLLIASL